MTARDFVYWLQGYFELGGGADGLSRDQVKMVKDHLGLVFKHEASSEAPATASKIKSDLEKAFERGARGLGGAQIC